MVGTPLKVDFQEFGFILKVGGQAYSLGLGSSVSLTSRDSEMEL